MIDDLFKLTIDKIYYPVYKYKNNDKFEYPFKVNNYNDNENIWELIGNIQIKKNINLIYFNAFKIIFIIVLTNIVKEVFKTKQNF